MTVDEAQAVARLREGGVVALPTETVYGLAGVFDREEAVEAIFRTKARPYFDPLIVHVLDVGQARPLVAEWPASVQALVERFWPGPLTVVLPKTERVSDRVTAGLPTVALRSPAHPVFRAVLRGVGKPLAAPSANRFGRTSPTAAGHVEREFDGRVPVVDGGTSEIGLESTVVAIEDGGVRVLRPGAVTEAMLRECLGSGVRVVHRTREDSPGHLEQHYQPEAPVWLVRTAEERRAHAGAAEMPLGDDPLLVARDLYGDLRRYSEAHPEGFVIRLDRRPNDGMWRAIRDRLERAASRP
ncbi:MAG: threonylcarbamoyl-AMP synthase [Gemmatimonadetes bacterium]|nr:threonylcarbamoyl-AMP synthase [Gemmatimonadota bacterium]